MYKLYIQSIRELIYLYVDRILYIYLVLLTKCNN